jgi:hypothetical protein
MRRRHAVFSGRVAGVALLRYDFTLAGQAALELRSDFFACSIFERIGATPGDQHAADHNQDRQGLHPLILGMNFAKANDKRLYNSGGFG